MVNLSDSSKLFFTDLSKLSIWFNFILFVDIQFNSSSNSSIDSSLTFLLFKLILVLVLNLILESRSKLKSWI